VKVKKPSKWILASTRSQKDELLDKISREERLVIREAQRAEVLMRRNMEAQGIVVSSYILVKDVSATNKCHCLTPIFSCYGVFDMIARALKLAKAKVAAGSASSSGSRPQDAPVVENGVVKKRRGRPPKKPRVAS
jgi:hypothetical protein